MNNLKLSLALLGTTILAACGGGGGGGIGQVVSSPSPTPTSTDMVLQAGQGRLVTDTVPTGDYLLSKAEWQIIPMSTSNPELTLRNQDCRVAEKNDVVNPMSLGPNGVPGLGKSTWTCSLAVVTPLTVQAEASYKLLLVGTDVLGQTKTLTKNLRVVPNPVPQDPTVGGASSDIEVTTAGNLVGRPGQTLHLEASTRWLKAGASGEPLVTYSWAIAPSAQQFAKLLKSTGSEVQLHLNPNQADPNSAEPIFVPLTVTASGQGMSASETVAVLVDPFAPLAPEIPEDEVVQTVGPRCEVKVEALGGSAGLFYEWKIVEGTPVKLAGANTLRLGFFAPDTEQIMRLRFAVGFYPISTTNPGVYFVDALVKVKPNVPCEPPSAEVR